MSDREFSSPHDTLAQRWRNLAERRRLYFIELYRSGRWQHYYDERALVAGLRQATEDVERWDAILKSQANASKAAAGATTSVPDEPVPLQMLLGLVGPKEAEAPFLPQADAA